PAGGWRDRRRARGRDLLFEPRGLVCGGRHRAGCLRGLGGPCHLLPDGLLRAGRAAGAAAEARGLQPGPGRPPCHGSGRRRSLIETRGAPTAPLFYLTISVPAPCSVKSSTSTTCGVLPLRITTPSTPLSSASRQVSTLGI